jgi:DnaJ-class molecular chaperone
MPIRSKSGDKTPSPLQGVLEWPGVDEICPRCHGAGQVYYLRTSRPGVEIVGGRRIVCPACAGAGVVRAPVHGEGASP